jgi:hypothetical protein
VAGPDWKANWAGDASEENALVEANWAGGEAFRHHTDLDRRNEEVFS